MRATTHRPLIWAAALTFALLAQSLAAPSAWAAGFYLPFRGVAPTGRAGAVTVAGGGPHAMWYNPAQLLEMEGTHVLLDASVVGFDSYFLRTPRLQPNGDLLVFDAVENQAFPPVIPNLIAVSDFGLERVAFGLGFMAPYGTLTTYPTEGAQRYTLIQNEETFAFQVALGVAYQVTDWFRVGATFQSTFVSNSTILAASGFQGIFGQPEDLDLDIRFRIDAVDPFTPMGNIGLWFQLAEGFELALAAQLGGEISDDDASLEVRLPTNAFFDDAELRGDTLAASLDLPAIVRAGFRWVHARGDVELDVTWENWAVHDELRADPGVLVLTGVFGIDEFAVGSLTVEKEWENTWGVSLGSDVVAIPERLTVRAGLLWEQGAIPDHRFSVFTWDADKVAPTLGVSVEVPEAHLVIHAAYSHVLLFDKTIDNSLVEQINPTFEEGAVIVGNGRYEASIDLVGLGIETAW